MARVEAVASVHMLGDSWELERSTPCFRQKLPLLRFFNVLKDFCANLPGLPILLNYLIISRDGDQICNWSAAAATAAATSNAAI